MWKLFGQKILDLNTDKEFFKTVISFKAPDIPLIDNRPYLTLITQREGVYTDCYKENNLPNFNY